MLETIKWLVSTESKINVPHSEVIEVVLVHYNIIDNDY